MNVEMLKLVAKKKEKKEREKESFFLSRNTLCLVSGTVELVLAMILNSLWWRVAPIAMMIVCQNINHVGDF